MKFSEAIVLEILALGLDNSTSDYRLEYLLKKLYGKDSLSLDHENQEFCLRIIKIADSLRD